MRPSGSTLREVVDPRWPADRSIVLRYRRALSVHEAVPEGLTAWLERTSLREGARVVELLRHRDAVVHLLDETSLMQTGSLKAIDGCVTIAHCKQAGWDAVVFESGGNTGSALTVYAAHAGLETHCFVPADNLALLDRATFAAPRAHLIAVEDAAAVKAAAAAFAQARGLPHVPRREWRHEASRIRGCFILEHMQAHGRYDWIVQSVSAAFGPLGIYATLDALGDGRVAPRFLGVQQAENCPLYRAWKSLPAVAEAVPHSTRHLLTRVMYDGTPLTYGTYDEVRSLLTAVRGDVVTIDRAAFAAFLAAPERGGAALRALGRHGIDLRLPLADPTGLMALAGTLQAIDDGTIAAGSTVLCCLTSGAARPDGAATPERRLHGMADRA